VANDKKGKAIKYLLIYTTGDFPYGMAPENLVRQLSLGLVFNDIRLKIIRLRGRWYNYTNDTGIEAQNFVLPRVPKNEMAKIFELITFILLIPFSVIKNTIKYKADGLILYGVEYFYLIFPYWIACRLMGIKLIRITTDFYHSSTVVPVWWKKPKLFFYKFQFKHFDKYLDGIVSLSQFMAEYAIECGVKREKIIVIPHFIDTESFSGKYYTIQQADKVRIGFCGSATEANGIFDLIEAFNRVHQKFPETELLIIGEPAPKEKIRIKQMASTDGNSVKITGLLSRPEVPVALLTCQILVNPRKSGLSAEAGFPTKLGEYFSCGLPVVATLVGDIKYYFTDKRELVMVNPDRPDELAEALIFLLNNVEESRQIGLRGYEWAKNNLDFKTNAAKLKEFLQLIM
jgi:glycosyltransferase involved in cell wall biosynthesis